MYQENLEEIMQEYMTESEIDLLLQLDSLTKEDRDLDVKIA